MRYLALCSIILISLSPLWLAAAPTAKFVESDLEIRDGRSKITVKDVIESDPNYVTLHAVQNDGEDYYVVYGISDWSRGFPSGRGFCGSGIESAIRWLHIRNGEIVKQQEGVYESCRDDRYGEIKWSNGKLQWLSEGLKRMEGSEPVYVHFNWVYDPADPSAGIIETVEPIE